MNFNERLAHLESQCDLIETDCADGKMPFRIWSPSASEQIASEAVVLLHGGSGSWNHWVRNIETLSLYYQVIVPDLPGLGDAASLSRGYRPRDAAGWVAKGIRQVNHNQPYHLVAFSWGCVVASLVAAEQRNLVKSITLVGPASMGRMPKPLLMKPLMPRTPDMSELEVDAANRENLARLMIFDRKKIDDFAVFLQTLNTRRARFRSPQFSSGTFVLDGLAQTQAPLCVIYGDRDAAAYPNIAVRQARVKAVRPDVKFEVVPNNGHWLQYESPEWFNTRCIQWIENHIF